jgi:hypothetical protein
MGSYADLELPSHYRPGGYEPPSYDTGDYQPVEDYSPVGDYGPAAGDGFGDLGGAPGVIVGGTAADDASPHVSDPLQAPVSPHLGLPAPAPWGAGGPWEPEAGSTGSTEPARDQVGTPDMDFRYVHSEPAFDLTSTAHDPLTSAYPYGSALTGQPEPPASDDRPRRPQPANPWREPTGPLTTRQAIIDLSARKRPRSRG